MEDNRIEIICSVERVRYYKDSWGIIEVSIDRVYSGTPVTDAYGTLILKGTMPNPELSGMYHVTADLVNDPKWGKQYELIRMYSAIVFDKNDKEAQKKFLSSLYTPKQIASMYETLEDPYEVLANSDAQKLVTVKGIGMHTAVDMIDKFQTNINLGRIFTELSEYNLTNNMIARLMKQYKSPDVVIEKVKENPYVLADEVDGIGWAKADQIARDGGIDEYDERRISAYIKRYLKVSGEEGRSWITTDELLGGILDKIGDDTPDEAITKAIQSIQKQLWYSDDKTRIGLKTYYDYERLVAEELIRLRDAEPLISSNDWNNWEQVLTKIEKRQGWTYTDEQREGIYKALTNNVILITGMAGTGKSSLVSGILEILKPHSYTQCALSGRAAARLSEITNTEGLTIHRLLGYPYKKEGNKQSFKYHDANPLSYEIYIVDEISMINTLLFYQLLRAIPSGAKLICLGDHGQLESIGNGNLAHDMIASPEITTVVLKKIHRQAESSGIISEAFKIRSGQQIVSKDWAGTDVRGELKDLNITGYSDANNTYFKIMAAYSSAMAKPDFNMMDTQILVPIKNKGNACTYELNNAIQDLVNPVSKRKEETTIYNAGKPYILREGDKIINNSNNYNLEPVIYNGNIGIIKKIDLEDDDPYMIAEFLNIGTVIIPKEFWHNLELGYAITVHKYQGSQSRHIIFGMDFSSYSLLTRELVYTAITRAVESCDLIVQTNALRYATGNEAVSKKQTHLVNLLNEIAHPKLVF